MFDETIFNSHDYADHKIFRESETDRISLADWSGGCPEQTEDGPLLVAPDAVGEVHLNRGILHFSLPVWSLRAQDWRTASTSIATAIALMKVRPLIKWTPTPEVVRLIAQLQALSVNLAEKPT